MSLIHKLMLIADTCYVMSKYDTHNIYIERYLKLIVNLEI